MAASFGRGAAGFPSIQSKAYFCFGRSNTCSLAYIVKRNCSGVQAARKGRALGQAAAVRLYSDRDRAREASSASKAAPPESGYVAAIWPGGRPGPAFTV